MPINHPAELPEGGEGGGSGHIRFRPGVGGPNELPPFVTAGLSSRYLIAEILNLRNRVHTLETNAVVMRLSGASSFLPNELPEGGEGGGGTGIFHPPKEIAELPIDSIVTLVSQVASLSQRLATLETNLLQSIQALQVRVDALKR
jgi:hypothetical protein